MKFGQGHAIARMLLLCAATFAAGCAGGGGAGSPAPASPSATTTSLAISSASIHSGGSVTLSAAVAASGGIPSGAVAFLDGSTQLASVPLDAAGNAAWSTSSFATGIHTLTAAFGGSAGWAASISQGVSLTVSAPAIPVTVSLTATPTASTRGLPVELAATVAPAANAATPTGTVTFFAGTTLLGTAALDSTGTAEYTTTLLPSGNNQITASYSGDLNDQSAASTAQAVNIQTASGSTYVNPLRLNVTANVQGVSCADPAIYKQQISGTNTWYLYCTSDALYPGDTRSHWIGIYHSSDLVNWTYDGDAFAGPPSWASQSGATMWAPAIRSFSGQYYLYYAMPSTSLHGGGSAIGVGVSSSPAGPFVDHGAPVVEPELATNCCTGTYRATIDPDILQDSSGQNYILFGSFAGGIFVRKLSVDGFTSDITSEALVAADNRFEGGNWWVHDGYYYLLASTTNCCNGPLTGYEVLAARAASPMGPYLDQQGVSLNAVNPGGTPALQMNGNSIIGPGGNVVFTDEAGQDYILYHGIEKSQPYYAGDVGYTARPVLMDALDWVNDWPVARGGFGPSDQDAPQPLPIAQPGAASSYVAQLVSQDLPRSAIASLSDDFTSLNLSGQWSFLHGTPAYALTGSAYEAQSVAFDTTNAMASVPLLAEQAPAGDFMVETKLDLTLPLSGSGADYAQAGMVIYGDDNNYLRLDLYSNNDTRQIEFINQETPEGSGYPSWGASNAGPPLLGSTVTAWLRIARRNVNGEQHYTAYSSVDGMNWIRTGTWVHALGATPRIALYAGNRSGYTATFHYVHVFTLQ